MPCQFTVAEHEQWWQITDAALAEYRALFTAAPSMIIRRQPGPATTSAWAGPPVPTT